MSDGSGSAVRPIDPATVRKICSGQVITDVTSCVKELVENALDAGAKSVAVRLVEHGTKLIEVSDDGSGVAKENRATMALRSWTSKIRDFDDLERLSSFGFRGEALASMCSCCGRVVVTTATAEGDLGSRIEFDRGGGLIKEEAIARQRGTTVSLIDIFAPFPVRATELQRNKKRELARAVASLQGYAVAASGVRLRCTHEHDGRLEELLCTEGAGLRETVARVFGGDFARSLVALDVAESGVVIRGLVCKGGVGRATPDRQLFTLNGRPVDLPRVAKQINSVFHDTGQANQKSRAQQYPSFVLGVQCDPSMYDINVTPDKRTVMLHCEAEIISAMQSELGRLWAGVLPAMPECEAASATQHPQARAVKRRAVTTPIPSSRQQISPHDQSGRCSRDGGDADGHDKPRQSKRLRHGPMSVTRAVLDSAYTTRLEDGREVRIANDSKLSPPQSSANEGVQSVVVRLDVEGILRGARELAGVCGSVDNGARPPAFTRKVGVDSDDECERELCAAFTKADFASLQVIGQFNLGFIIAKLGRNLFIVDQHAADEIYNFEELTKTTRLQTQPLISPVRLEMSGEDELLVIDSLDVFRDHGFVLQVDRERDPGHRISMASCVLSKSTSFGVNDVYELISVLKDNPAPLPPAAATSAQTQSAQTQSAQTQSAQTQSAQTQSAQTQATNNRLSRVRAMIASRACRRSIMIGDALGEAQMGKVLQHLSNLDRPWRCPHGRPTMRHLVNLDNIVPDDEAAD